jgi:hypothetical protein
MNKVIRTLHRYFCTNRPGYFFGLIKHTAAAIANKYMMLRTG